MIDGKPLHTGADRSTGGKGVGQYYIICNMDKREFLESHWFGHGAKLPDIARSKDGAMTGLAVLLALSGSGRYVDGHIYGRWAGHRIAIIGDYYEGTVAGIPIESEEAYTRIELQQDGWVEIGEHVRALLERDWELTLPPPGLDGAEPRSILHDDGTITAVPQPVYDEVTQTWLPPQP